MKDTVQHIVDGKIATAALTSGAGTLVTWAERVDPIVDVVSGIVAIVAGLFAIAWTVMRIIDRYKDK